MSDRLLDFSGSEIEFAGEFFRGSAAVKLKDNLAVHVGKLAEDGRKYVVRQIANRPYPNARASRPERRRTGFTQKHIEAAQKPRNSLYAKVRMEPDAERPGARSSRSVKAERLPYVILAVLETGKRGGTRQRVVSVSSKGTRMRTRWKAGQQSQKPLYAFRNAARKMREQAPAIRDSLLLKGLE